MNKTIMAICVICGLFSCGAFAETRTQLFVLPKIDSGDAGQDGKDACAPILSSVTNGDCTTIKSQKQIMNASGICENDGDVEELGTVCNGSSGENGIGVCDDATAQNDKVSSITKQYSTNTDTARGKYILTQTMCVGAAQTVEVPDTCVEIYEDSAENNCGNGTIPMRCTDQTKTTDKEYKICEPVGLSGMSAVSKKLKSAETSLEQKVTKTELFEGSGASVKVKDSLLSTKVITTDTLASTMGVTPSEGQTIGQKLSADMASAASGAINNIDATFLANKGGITTGNLESTLGIDGQEGDSVATKLQAKVTSVASATANSAATLAANNAASAAINNLTSTVLADKMGITLGANETLSDKIVTNDNITNILQSSGAMDNVVKTTVDGKIDASVLPTDVANKLSNLGTCVTTIDAETGKEVIDSCTGVLGILASKSGAVSQ